jgi:DNA-binding NarL/FixJ family response regulator
MPMKRKIIIVDDHPVVRQGMTQLINQETDLEVCGQIEEASKVIDLIKKIKPDLVILDLSLKDTSGIEVIKDIKVSYQDLPILVLSMHDESLYAERVLRLGAMGYIMKHEATEKIIFAIRQVLNGNIYASDNILGKILRKAVGSNKTDSNNPLEILSDRELEIFQFIGDGLKTSQIAAKLNLSTKTIEVYKEKIKEKLNLQSGAELTRYCIEYCMNEKRKI